MSAQSQLQNPNEVDRAAVATAVAALFKWMRARAAEAPPNLLTDERDDLVILQLSLRRIPSSSATKPRLLPLLHPVLLPGDSASVCVISDDRPKSTRSPAATDIADKAKSHGLPVSEVIPLSALRTDYRPYESRRRLAASHDLFIADRGVLPLLPRVLGKAFYSTKKAPVAVDFTRAGWPEQVRKVMSSTFLYLRSGTCSGIKVGRLDMKEEEIVENVMAAVAAAVEKVPKKWANVRALHLKAVDSVALPIYQVVPELGMKIEVPVAQLEIEAGCGEVIDAAEVETGKKSMGKKKMLQLTHVEYGVVVEAAKESGKRKRSKKKQAEDVMEEDVTEKRKKVKGTTSAVEELKVSKKGREKSKRALDKEEDDGSVEKKGRKNEHASEEASNKKKKGKKEVESDIGEKISKGKKSNGNKEKKRTSYLCILQRFKVCILAIEWKSWKPSQICNCKCAGKSSYDYEVKRRTNPSATRTQPTLKVGGTVQTDRFKFQRGLSLTIFPGNGRHSHTWRAMEVARADDIPRGAHALARASSRRVA
uniref:Ribosomal protein L1 n=1 Tax=Leersia perrieri TaxID=77586 RepID=A0A0D9WJL9_9ORYZ